MDDTGGIEKYKYLEKMEGHESEIEQGKIIKIKAFRETKKWNYFGLLFLPTEGHM